MESLVKGLAIIFANNAQPMICADTADEEHRSDWKYAFCKHRVRSPIQFYAHS